MAGWLIIPAILLFVKGLTTFAPAPDYASEAFVGLGIGVSFMVPVDGVFLINIGYKEKISNHTYMQYKCGYFNRIKPINKYDFEKHKYAENYKYKYNSSFFAFAGPGLEVDLNPFETRACIGLGAILSTKKQMDSSFPQLNEDVYIGIKDKENNSIGFQYEHMSNADIKLPNYSRNFILTRVGRKWR
ncbi:MAG: acyloxyacyl hydrolase [Elusimicrobia bacterium]|nr:acyloxyacyl hydrolase [Elusimicrobiota bacterium]